MPRWYGQLDCAHQQSIPTFLKAVDIDRALKAETVVGLMQRRLRALGGTVGMLSTINVYTAFPVASLLDQIVIPELASEGDRNIRCHHTRPPIVDIEFEMDLRGVAEEVTVDLMK